MPSGCARWSPTPRSCSSRRWMPGRTCAPGRSGATLLDVDHGTYPFVTSSSATAWVLAPAPASRRPGCHGSSRSSRRTRRASVRARSPPSCSTTTARRCARRASSTARPPAARATRLAWTPSSGATPTGSTASPTSSSPSSTCSPASRRCRSVSPTRSTGSGTTRCRVDQSDFHHAKPVYEHLAGGARTSRGARTFDDLPAAAQAYVLRVEELVGARVSAIGVGPGRHEIIQRHPLLD